MNKSDRLSVVRGCCGDGGGQQTGDPNDPPTGPLWSSLSANWSRSYEWPDTADPTENLIVNTTLPSIVGYIPGGSQGDVHWREFFGVIGMEFGPAEIQRMQNNLNDLQVHLRLDLDGGTFDDLARKRRIQETDNGHEGGDSEIIKIEAYSDDDINGEATLVSDFDAPVFSETMSLSNGVTDVPNRRMRWRNQTRWLNITPVVKLMLTNDIWSPSGSNDEIALVIHRTWNMSFNPFQNDTQESALGSMYYVESWNDHFGGGFNVDSSWTVEIRP